MAGMSLSTTGFPKLKRLKQQKISGKWEGRSVALHCDLTDEDAVNQLLNRVRESLGTPVCLVNNASVFEHDSVTDSRPMPRFSYAYQPDCACPVITGLVCNDSGRFPIRRHQFARPETGQSEPEFSVLYLVESGTEYGHNLAGAGTGSETARCRHCAGITLVSGEQTEQDFKIAHKNTPLGRSSTPEDIASTVCFVANSPAITGTTIVVDGGQHLIPLSQDVMFVAKMSAQNNS